MKTKKQEVAEFEIADLLGISMTLVVLVIGIAYGLQVTGDIKDDMGETACAARTDSFTLYNTASDTCYNSSGSTSAVTNSAEYNATVDGMTGISKIPEKLPTIVTIVIAAVIIGILVRYLWRQFA